MKRRFSRGGGRPFNRRVRNIRHVPPLLRRANALMEEENYAEAARAFEKVAKRAQANLGPRAPLYYIRAGRAFILAKNTQEGMSRLLKGLSLIARREDWSPLLQIGKRATAFLQELGLEEEAKEIEAFLKRFLPADTSLPPLRRGGTLPVKCPHCGAPLRSDEVVWINEKDAECPYCGNPVREEN